VRKGHAQWERILWTGEEPKTKPVAVKFQGLILLTLFLLVFMGGSLFYVWSRIQVIQIGYAISEALKEERNLTLVNKKLRLEIATLKSYARIEKIAFEELGMVRPKPEQVIVIR